MHGGSSNSWYSMSTNSFINMSDGRKIFIYVALPKNINVAFGWTFLYLTIEFDFNYNICLPTFVF